MKKKIKKILIIFLSVILFLNCIIFIIFYNEYTQKYIISKLQKEINRKFGIFIKIKNLDLGFNKIDLNELKLNGIDNEIIFETERLSIGIKSIIFGDFKKISYLKIINSNFYFTKENLRLIDSVTKLNNGGDTLKEDLIFNCENLIIENSNFKYELDSNLNISIYSINSSLKNIDINKNINLKLNYLNFIYLNNKINFDNGELSYNKNGNKIFLDKIKINTLNSNLDFSGNINMVKHIDSLSYLKIENFNLNGKDINSFFKINKDFKNIINNKYEFSGDINFNYRKLDLLNFKVYSKNIVDFFTEKTSILFPDELKKFSAKNINTKELSIEFKNDFITFLKTRYSLNVENYMEDIKSIKSKINISLNSNNESEIIVKLKSENIENDYYINIDNDSNIMNSNFNLYYNFGKNLQNKFSKIVLNGNLIYKFGDTNPLKDLYIKVNSIVFDNDTLNNIIDKLKYKEHKKQFLNELTIKDEKINLKGKSDFINEKGVFQINNNYKINNICLNCFKYLGINKKIILSPRINGYVKKEFGNWKSDIKIKYEKFEIEDEAKKTFNTNFYLSQNQILTKINYSSSFIDIDLLTNFKLNNFKENLYSKLKSYINNDSINKYDSLFLKLDIITKNGSDDFLNLLNKKYHIDNGCRINFSFKDSNDFVFLKCPKITYNSIGFEKIDGQISNLNGKIHGDVKIKKIIDDNRNIRVNNIDLLVNGNLNTSNLNLKFDSVFYIQEFKNANLKMRLSKNKLGNINTEISNSHFEFKNQKWNLNFNYIYLDSLNNFQNLNIQTDNKFIQYVNNKKHNEREVFLNFDNLDLSMLNPFLANSGTTISGIIDGKIKIDSSYKNNINKIEIKDFIVNNVKFGMFEMKLNELTFDKAYLDLNIKNKINGNIFYNINDNSIKSILFIDTLPVKFLNPYFGNNISFKKGFVVGNSIIEFKNKLNISGEFFLKDAELLVNKINSNFNLESIKKISWNDDTLNIGTIEIKQDKVYKGIIDGGVYFKKDDIYFNFNSSFNNLLAYNKLPYKTNFFGNLILDGDFSLYGKSLDFDIEVNGSLDNNSTMGIDLDENLSRSVETGIITFLNPKEEIQENENDINKNAIYSLLVKLKINPGVKTDIKLDPHYGDNLTLFGNAEMLINFTKDNQFFLNGIYNIVQGSYNFTLRNLVNKNFKVNEGSLISFNGNMNNAKININGLYQTRVSLRNLNIPTEDSLRDATVNCNVNLQGNLLTPDLNLGLELLNVQTETKSYFSNIINSVEEINKNFLSVLIFNRLIKNQNNPTGSLLESSSNSLIQGSYEILTGQINSWLSKTGINLNLGINYLNADEKSKEEFRIFLSKEFLNSKIVLNTSVGIGGNNSNSKDNSRVTSNINIDIKPSKSENVKLNIYNKTDNSSTIDPTSSQNEYEQGVGISFSKSFNSLKDLKKNKDTTRTKKN